MTNKHEVLKAWVETYLDGVGLSFENIDITPGARSVVPDIGEYTTKTDVIGRKYKQYTFGFIAIEVLDTQDTTTNNAKQMFDVEQFNTWLEEQQKLRNFPNFGDNTTEYEIVPLYNMPSMNVGDNNMAKYILMARIEYVEKG